MHTTGRRLLIGLLGGAGVLHFVAPKPFDSIVPGQLPGSARAYTLVSGVAEIGCAGALACRDERVRRAGGWAAAALMLAVWPANFEMARQYHDPARGKPWWAKAIAVLRLPLQVPLIWAGLEIGRGPRRG
ncbi:DoxX family protein [Corynebacterium atypicum]|uniref:DoxX family protein n=1 Tax=Corynebacterium atypicum TaxID=191610 RepID=UPI000571F62B|nr:hypothetical protein [Corynebacterium atypicum]